MGSKHYPYWWFYRRNRFWHWERHEASGDKKVSVPFETLSACRGDALAYGYNTVRAERLGKR